MGRLARAVVENVDAQFKRRGSEPQLRGQWQTWQDLPNVEWKIDNSNLEKVSSAIRAKNSIDEEVVTVTTSPKFYGDVRWETSNPQLGVVTAQLGGLRTDRRSPTIGEVKFSGDWQFKDFGSFVGKRLTHTDSINGASLKEALIGRLVSEALAVKKAFNDDQQIDKSKVITDKYQFRRIADGFKIVIKGDGELIAKVKNNQLISVERRDENNAQVLAVVKAKEAVSLEPANAKVVFFNGLTAIEELSALQKVSSAKAPQTAPRAVAVLLREAEAARDLYYGRNVTSFSTGLPKGYGLTGSDAGLEPRLKLTAPNGNSLEFSIDSFGHITSIQRDDKDQTLIVLPAAREAVIGNNSKVSFHEAGVLGTGSSTDGLFKLVSNTAAVTTNTTHQSAPGEGLEALLTMASTNGVTTAIQPSKNGAPTTALKPNGNPAPEKVHPRIAQYLERQERTQQLQKQRALRH